MPGDGSIKGASAKIAGKNLDQWDDQWEEMEGGFSVEHASLDGVVGLYRARRGNQTKIIGSGTDFDNGGLSKRLQTLRSDIVQSGNNHVAGNYIRENASVLKLDVIKVGTGAGIELVTRKLVQAMRKKYGLRRGVIPPD
ncbi:hypothetical protein [Sphingomonas sp. RS2018]